MGDYESGFDPKYGYNRNAFAHKTLGTALMGRVVKLIVTPIGLGSEAIHHLRDKKKRSESQPDAVAADATTSIAAEETRPQDNASPSEGLGDSVYVNVPENQADELIASYQAVLADGETATHELVPEQLKNDGFERDEADWALDEAASETEEKDESLAQVQSDKEEPSTETSTLGMQLGKPKADTHLKNAPLKKLPFPVILPQRRPGTKTRGFVRAYAPVLQDPGIDQEMFLRFLKNFHSAAQASPIFDIIMIATGIVGLYPDAMVGLAVQAVQIMAGIGQEVQERWRTNKFLDQANKDFFIPKGLFALIVTYKPGHSDQTEVETQTVDLGASAMAKYGDDLVAPEKTTSNEGEEREKQKRMDEMKEKMKKLRIASGETKEAEIPVTCAPLSFPALDAIADNAQKDGNTDGVANSIKAKAKSSSKFVNEYFDRRAQATYAAANPQSTLTTQMAPAAPEFKSRFADPNNATNMHFFTLITGGRYKAEPLGARRRYERAQRKAEEKRLQGQKEKGSKRLLQEGVLYLTIVNMPTEQELENARKQIQEAKEKKAAAKKKAAESGS